MLTLGILDIVYTNPYMVASFSEFYVVRQEAKKLRDMR